MPESKPSQSPSNSTEEKSNLLDNQLVRLGLLVVLVLVALYPVVYGLRDIIWGQEKVEATKITASVEEDHVQRQDPSFFEKVFCMGGRRSSLCD